MKREEVKELLWRTDVLLTVAALKIGCKGRVSLETWRQTGALLGPGWMTQRSQTNRKENL